MGLYGNFAAYSGTRSHILYMQGSSDCLFLSIACIFDLFLRITHFYNPTLLTLTFTINTTNYTTILLHYYITTLLTILRKIKVKKLRKILRKITILSKREFVYSFPVDGI